MFSIVEGKARNVDYILSCKLRLLERLILEIRLIGEAMASRMPGAIVDVWELPKRGCEISTLRPRLHSQVSVEMSTHTYTSCLKLLDQPAFLLFLMISKCKQ